MADAAMPHPSVRSGEAEAFRSPQPATIISNFIPNGLDRAGQGTSSTNDGHLLFTLGPAQISHRTALR